jgi:hypothetical protein
MEAAEKSPHRLLLLYGASYLEGDYLEEEMDIGVCKYASGYLSDATLLWSTYSRTHRNSPPPYCDEKEVNIPEETSQPSTSRYPKYFLNITSAELHKIVQK